MPLELLATSTMGLEAVVSRELDALGYDNNIVETGRIRFEGEAQAVCDANLWLRAAGRVLIVVGRFPAPDFDALFDRTRELEWERWIPRDGQFVVNGRSVKSQLSSVPACQRTVKKAIAERLLKAHATQTLSETGATFPIEVSLLKDEAVLSIDTSGSGLHKRGYRKLVGPAPLRETLAAGMIQLSFWAAERPFIDPFCGSGTIPIEAALIGRNIAPGLRRAFVAETWPTFPAEHWRSARQTAEAMIRPPLEERLIATDIDEDALSLARYHAKNAGVEEDIHFQRRAFADLLSKREYGCVITNPPYAMRLGDEREVAELYESLPHILRRLPTWSHYILTAYPDFEKLVGQAADRRRKLYNSRIECTYYQFHGPRPPKDGERPRRPDKQATFESDAPPPPDPVQAFGGVGAKANEQAEIFANRLKKQARHLRRWPTRRGVTCYRLYDRDVPEVPLIVDRYEDCLHIAEYDRPHERTPAEHADWLDLMARTAAKTLEVDRANVFLKRRRRQRGESQYEKVAQDSRTIVANEGGLKFECNLSDYLDTGLFLDHRQTRSMVRDESQGRRMLNLFAYTGSFSVYAAAGGATTTTTVDLSANYLDWAARNMWLNGFTDKVAHAFVRADAMEFLQRLPKTPLFDLAVVDPPTFSNSKRTDDDWDVATQHVDLLAELTRRMSAGGVIYFSNNFRRFRLDEDRLPSNLTVREISKKTVPEDFRNKRIHRCWRMVVEG